jgi:hypothetical protein
MNIARPKTVESFIIGYSPVLIHSFSLGKSFAIRAL